METRQPCVSGRTSLSQWLPRRVFFPCFFECGGWRSSSRAGRRYLRGFLCKLPDNKIVEDIHHSIRTEARGNPNSTVTFNTMQNLVVSSSALEARGIPHPPALTLEVFEREFHSTRVRMGHRRRHRGWKHKLEKSWSKLMGKRVWRSPTPEGLHIAGAARRWLQNYMTGYGIGLPGRSLASGAFSKLVLPHVLVVNEETPDQALASLGSAKWAALGWPVTTAGEHDGQALYKLAPTGEVSLMYPTQNHSAVSVVTTSQP